MYEKMEEKKREKEGKKDYGRGVIHERREEVSECRLVVVLRFV